MTESAFADVDAPSVLLDLNADPQPTPAVERWLASPLRTRCIGPGYDPHQTAEYYLEAGPLRHAVDYLFHFTNVTPASFFPPR